MIRKTAEVLPIRRFVLSMLAFLLLCSPLLPVLDTYAEEAPNLILNPSAETLTAGTPANWSALKWGTNNATLSTATGAQDGSVALAISATAHTSGDAKWMPTPVNVNAGATYTFSNYSKASVATEIDAVYTDANGAVSYHYLASVQPSTNWQQNTVSLTVPAGITKVAIVHILYSAGTLTTDNYSLTNNAPPASGNLIANPSFEAASGNAPQQWTPSSWGTHNAGFSYVTNEGHEGTASAKIQIGNYTNGDAKWFFTPVAVQSGAEYTFSDYYKATIPTSLVARFDNGSGGYTYAQIAAPTASASWKQVSATFTTPATAKFLTIFHLIAGVGTLQVDDASLLNGTGPADPPPTGGNLILNPSAETLTTGGTPANWTPSTWGTSSTTLSTTSGAQNGSVALTIDTTARTSGDAKWASDPVTVTAGHTYTFSNYSKASVATEIDAAYTNASGQVSYQYLATVQAGANWQKNTVSLTIPAGMTKVTIMHILASAGTLTTDNYRLIDNAAPVIPPENLIPNPSVEVANGSNPSGWTTGKWGANNASFTYVTSGGHDGTASLKVQIGTYTSGSAYWRTAAPQNITGGQLYVYRDYYQSNVPTDLNATLTLSNGSTQDVWLGTAFASPEGWSKFEAEFTAPASAVSVVFYHDIHSAGYVTTDSYRLTPFAYEGFARALVTITDDDGFANFYTNGLPILQKYGLPSTAYVMPGYLGAPNYLTTSQLLALHNAGVEIGSHSVGHEDLTMLTPAQQEAELQQSQAALQSLLGVPVPHYAAPYGVHNDQLTARAANYYQSYRSTDLGYNGANNFDLRNLHVQNVDATTTLADIQSWLQQAAATKTWLILVYHQINPNQAQGGEHSVTPAVFDAQMAAVKASGITAKTVSGALSELLPQL